MKPGRDLWDLLDADNKGKFVQSNKHIGFSFGTVVNPPSTDPLKHNRIQVTMPPWKPDQTTPWVRMISPGCGIKSGLHFPPKKGDKVVVFAYRGDPHQLVYMPYPTVQTSPPDEQRVGVPEQRWMIRTENGHKLELFEEDSVCHNNLETEKGHQVLEDDVAGQEKILIKEYEGRYINLDSNQDWIDIKTNSGNRVRLRDVQGDILVEHPSGSFEWIKKNGDVHVHAEEELRFTGKKIVVWPSEDLTWHIPSTTHKCVDEGIDYVNCPPPPRETRCFDCETGEETNETPQVGVNTNQVEFTQNNPSNEWNVNHNKGKYPQVTVLQDGYVVDGYSIQHLDKNTLKIYFENPQTGLALCD